MGGSSPAKFSGHSIVWRWTEDYTMHSAGWEAILEAAIP